MAVAGFYSALLLLKTIYSLWQSGSMYMRWDQDGLFAYNSKLYFVTTAVMGLAFGLIPYITFGLITGVFSKSIVLTIGTGVAVAVSDVFVDYYFRNSTDAQTGIAVMFMYAFLLMCIFCVFVVVDVGLVLVEKFFGRKHKG